MQETAKLVLANKTVELPVLSGSEGEKGIVIKSLRDQTGYITLDDGYNSTGSCESKVTFIDGDKGILRYRGIPIEELAEKSSFLECAYLIIWGELPTPKQLARFSDMVAHYSLLPESFRHHFQGFPTTSHPMAILSAMMNTISCFTPHLQDFDDESRFEEAVARLLGGVKTVAAFTYKAMMDEPYAYSRPDLKYSADFIHMLFSKPHREMTVSPELADALDLIFLLHADHEQNCSTSTVRMVGSSRANLFASVSAGICALWGPLHGGANQEVISMLDEIHRSGQTVQNIVAKAKQKDSGFRLFGFGHRVYKNFDPRARIIKGACDRVLAKTGKHDPLLDIAKELEEAALSDPYFVERRLYPNVDFYSGIIMRAVGIPLNMFTVLFAIGRMPGWIANWREVRFGNTSGRIYRPRQIYQGPTLRSFDEAKIREQVGARS